MYEEILSEIGLTKSEIAVYFALLELGSSTTGPIIKKADIASGKSYLILDKLLKKGLVTYVIKSGKKHYSAKSPERISDFLKEKETKLKNTEKDFEKILPSLMKKYSEEVKKPKAEIYEGIKGFKTYYESILKEMDKGETIDILGVPREVNIKYQPYFLEWNEKRIKKGIKMRILYNHDSRDFGKLREKMKLTEVKYMKKGFETPAWIDIYKDYVGTINVHGEPICFVIKNLESADSYKKYFQILWKQAKK